MSPSLPLLSFEELAIRLVLAALLGGLIGFEREVRDHEAGLRTHLLVAVGSSLFTIVSAYGFADFFNGNAAIRADPSRIAAQIVAGVGFLGAGAIFRQGAFVRGLTTAATLWAVAAIGSLSEQGSMQRALSPRRSYSSLSARSRGLPGASAPPTISPPLRPFCPRTRRWIGSCRRSELSGSLPRRLLSRAGPMVAGLRSSSRFRPGTEIWSRRSRRCSSGPAGRT